MLMAISFLCISASYAITGVDAQWNNPAVFWHLDRNRVMPGPGTYKITRSETKSIVRSIKSFTQSTNKASVGLETTVGGVLKAFSVSVSMSVGFEHTSTTSNEKNFQESLTKSTQYEVTQTLAKNTLLAPVAMMKMYTFKDANNKVRRLILIDSIVNLVVSKETLKNVILDKSWDSFLPTLAASDLKTYKLDEMQQKIEASGVKIPKVDDETTAVIKEHSSNPKCSSILLPGFNKKYWMAIVRPFFPYYRGYHTEIELGNRKDHRTKFCMEKRGGNRIALKARNGDYVGVWPTMWTDGIATPKFMPFLTALNRRDCLDGGRRCEFELRPQGDGNFVLESVFMKEIFGYPVFVQVVNRSYKQLKGYGIWGDWPARVNLEPTATHIDQKTMAFKFVSSSLTYD